VICFFGGSAGAAALASASLKITNFVWYIDSDNSGDHTAADQVLTSALNAGSQDTHLRETNDSAVTNVRLNVGGSEWSSGGLGNRSRTAAAERAPLDLPRVCVGEACQSAPSPVVIRDPFVPTNPAEPDDQTNFKNAADFDPIDPKEFTNDTEEPIPQFANSDQMLFGFYTEVPSPFDPGDPYIDEAVGLRADVSLPVVDLDTTSAAVAFSSWSNRAIVAANQDFDTYFEVEFVAQAYTQLSTDESSESSAIATVDFLVAVVGDQSLVWLPSDLNLSANTLTPGGSDQRATTGTTYSYSSSSGMLRLTAGQSYNVIINARTDVNATGNIPSVELPAPPVVWLLAIGLIGLIASRKTFEFYTSECYC